MALLLATAPSARLKPEYMALCFTCLAEVQLPGGEPDPCGDFVRQALAGKQYYQMPSPRWEGLIFCLGIAQMAVVSANPDYALAFSQIWWSICQYERHNHGGIMSAEKACDCGNRRCGFCERRLLCCARRGPGLTEVLTTALGLSAFYFYWESLILHAAGRVE